MLRSAGWESVQAVWPLHARLFAAVAGKGISALDMPPANCRPGTRQASATSTGRLVPWPDSAPTRTAPPPIISTSRQPRVALTVSSSGRSSAGCGTGCQRRDRSGSGAAGRVGPWGSSWTCLTRAPIDITAPSVASARGSGIHQRAAPRARCPCRTGPPVAGHRPAWESGPARVIPPAPPSLRDRRPPEADQPSLRQDGLKATIDVSPVTLYISIRGRKLPQRRRSTGSRCTCGCSLAPGSAGRGRVARSIRPVRYFPWSAGMVAAPTGAAAMGAIRMDVPDAADGPSTGGRSCWRKLASQDRLARRRLCRSPRRLSAENRHPTLLFPRQREVRAGGSHSARPRFGPAEFPRLLDLPKELTQ